MISKAPEMLFLMIFGNFLVLILKKKRFPYGILNYKFNMVNNRMQVKIVV